MVTDAIQLAEKNSIREFAPGIWGGFVGAESLGFMMPSADMLSPWGTIECDVQLRLLHYRQHNLLWSGAVDIWIEKLLSTPYEISGGRNLTYTWQDIFFDAEFGEGYDTLMQKASVDYLTLNRGAFFELVSYGASDTPLNEGARILGINHLDAMRIWFTGNREFPYIYQSEITGTLHQLHYTRVRRWVHQPSPNTRMFGMGKSALFNALTVANAQIMLGKHQNELLNDLPPPGLVVFNNVKSEDVDGVMEQFEYERRRDGQSIYRAPVRLSSKDPAQPATVTFVPLSQVPEGFNYRDYMDMHVNLMALALNLDPQDIWPLSSSAMGSGTQSKILSAKTQNKGPGYETTRLERMWNTTLPKPLEWKFKAQNGEQDLETANIAKLWVDIANLSPLDQMEKRQLVANQVPAVADVIMDEQGNVRLPDDDPKAQGQETIATDNVELDTPDAAQQDVTASDTAQADTTTEPPPDEEKKPFSKALADTESAFVAEMQAAMQDGVDRVVTKASTAARIRGAIQRYGKLAYQDGLEYGGVDSSELDEDDTRIIADYNVADSIYVSDLVNEIYSKEGMRGNPDTRAPLWLVTLDAFYYAGLESADRNGMYTFEGDDGKESCKDCQRLKGVTHRMKWWVSNELRPGVDTENFDCGGWNCQHYLEKAA